MHPSCKFLIPRHFSGTFRSIPPVMRASSSWGLIAFLWPYVVLQGTFLPGGDMEALAPGDALAPALLGKEV